MARQVIDTTTGAGDTGQGGGNKINAMTLELYTSTALTQRMATFAGGLTRKQTWVTLGDSHMTEQGFNFTLSYTLARYYNADIEYYSRKVFTSNTDATIIANRGNCYATGGATPAHMTGTQLPKLLADITAGTVLGCTGAPDVVATDFAAYNQGVTSQTDLDTLITTSLSVCTQLFAAGVAYIVVQGLFGQNPTLCVSWANMWRRQEALSNGRIRFVDVAPLLADLTATNNTWNTTTGWRGGVNVFGAFTSDGTHLNNNGSRQVAPAWLPVIQSICPRKFNMPWGVTNAAYDPVNLPWGDALGSGGSFVGNNGLDAAGGGTQPNGPVIPGTGSSGLTNRWYVTSTGSLVRNVNTTSGTDGAKVLNSPLSGATANGDTFEAQYQMGVTNFNNSDATRKWIMAAEVNLVGINGLADVVLRAVATNNSTWDTPGKPGAASAGDGYPDGTTETLLLRSLYPVAWSGNNPTFDVIFDFYADARTTSRGAVQVRKAGLIRVE